jgi:hypothetical protein
MLDVTSRDWLSSAAAKSPAKTKSERRRRSPARVLGMRAAYSIPVTVSTTVAL